MNHDLYSFLGDNRDAADELPCIPLAARDFLAALILVGACMGIGYWGALL